MCVQSYVYMSYACTYVCTVSQYQYNIQVPLNIQLICQTYQSTMSLKTICGRLMNTYLVNNRIYVRMYICIVRTCGPAGTYFMRLIFSSVVDSLYETDSLGNYIPLGQF